MKPILFQTVNGDSCTIALELSDRRKQYVVVDGHSSPTLQVVPQGSVLGPFLFVIYLNDVAGCISGSSKINLFADDIALYRIFTDPADYIALQADVNTIVSQPDTMQTSVAICSIPENEFIQYPHLASCLTL